MALACLVVLGVQRSEMRQLQRELLELREQGALREAHGSGGRAADLPATTPPAVVVPQADAAGELERLRSLVAELSAELGALQTLKAETEQLRARAVAQAGLDAQTVQNLENARARAMRIQCVNNLKQLGLAVRIYSTDHDGTFPPDVQTISNEIVTPKILVCPADEGRLPAPDWASFTPAHTSYEYLAPLGSELEPQRVVFRCSLHDNIALGDGSVQQLKPEHRTALVQRDGKLFFEYQAPPQVPTGQMPRMDPRLMERYGLLPPTETPATEATPPEPEP